MFYYICIIIDQSHPSYKNTECPDKNCEANIPFSIDLQQIWYSKIPLSTFYTIICIFTRFVFFTYFFFTNFTLKFQFLKSWFKHQTEFRGLKLPIRKDCWTDQSMVFFCESQRWPTYIEYLKKRAFLHQNSFTNYFFNK